jgi:hypothetical protein
LKELLKLHPRLAEMFRFHIDLWCGQKYYPRIGDCGSFAQPDTNYVAVGFSQNPGVGPSMYAFLWQLYELTKDPAFAQVVYHANGGKTDGLPYDLFAVNPARFQQRRGGHPAARQDAEARSVNKKEWHLAVLQGGWATSSARLWLDYDSGGYHSHADGLNIGLFAYGLDLLPDFGYPPVQFGGWGAPRATWYTKNSGAQYRRGGRAQSAQLGWPHDRAPGVEGATVRPDNALGRRQEFSCCSRRSPLVYDLERYERTVAMADVSDDEFYVFDLFRVQGGKDHARMTYSASAA